MLYRPVVFPADMQNRDMLRPTFAMLVIRIGDLSAGLAAESAGLYRKSQLSVQGGRNPAQRFC